jgi:3-methyladenine DNA glycosylase AlkC
MSNFDLAKNPNTPPETLEHLANDKDWLVRCRVARNLNTTTETLERLANDEDWYVRYEVAKNPNTPQYILTYFKIKKFLTHYNCFNHE